MKNRQKLKDIPQLRYKITKEDIEKVIEGAIRGASSPGIQGKCSLC